MCTEIVKMEVLTDGKPQFSLLQLWLTATLVLTAILIHSLVNG